MDALSVIETLRQALPDVTVTDAGSVDMPSIRVEPHALVAVAGVLRDHPDLQFAFFSDLTAVDHLPAEPRFELVYHLACLGAAYSGPGGAAVARRLRVKVPIAGHDAHAATVTGVYPAAGWPEREVFDLIGIVFDGHADLRRILMADDWEGHPLRKDYPVQIRKHAASWSPMQMTAEEFAHRITATREGAVGQSKAGPFDTAREAAKRSTEG
jgi:NADH/F420H2 dehydrogenase subunit C